MEINNNRGNGEMDLTSEIGASYWGNVDGEDVQLHQLQNENGMVVSITNFGASITAITVPGKNGRPVDMVLGYDSLQGYIEDPYYMGGVVGRYANRIAGGLITIDGKVHQLTIKAGGYHHHGGAMGFNKKVWASADVIRGGYPAVRMTYLSADGEEGFPGNLAVTVFYTLTDDNQLLVDFSATTDETTILNLTQHTYFNLTGQTGGDILDHELIMPLTNYLPVNNLHVPKGTLAAVKDTPFDFTSPKAIGARVNDSDEQMQLGAGYDHTWVIKQKDSGELKLCAKVKHPESGHCLTVYTTEPSVHLYTGNHLDGKVPGKFGIAYPQRGGLCLETQHYPDSPNHPHFPSTVLRPGEQYSSRTIFEFTIDE